MKQRQFWVRFWAATVFLSTAFVSATIAPSALAEDGILKAEDRQAQINLRQSPDPNSRSLGYGLVGDRVELLERAPGSDDYTWYRVRFYGSGAVGWIRNDFIQPEGTGAISPQALYQAGYDQGQQDGHRDGQNARRYNAGNHPDKFLQAGSGNPDPNYDRGYRDGFVAGFDAAYRSTTPAPSNGTVLTFQTSANAVRIFNRSGQTLMNVFDKRNGAMWLNGVPVKVEPSSRGTYYRYQGDVTVVAFQGNDSTRTLEIDGKVEAGY